MNMGYFSNPKRYKEQAGLKEKRICTLKDGTIASVQASQFHHCVPKQDNAEKYRAVEAWFWKPDKRFKEGRRMLTEEPLSYLPVKKLMEIIDSHGGIVSGELPPLDLGEE
jgi:hypothetical protein